MSFLFQPNQLKDIDNFDSIVPLIENESFDLLLDIHSNVINDFNHYIDDPRCIDKQYIKIKVMNTTWFDCYLLIWNKNSISKIHDHSENGCLYKILRGCLREEKFSTINLNKITEKDLDEGCINYIDNSMAYHRMSNQSPDISISIHFYSPPNFEMNIYN